jgi:uncharacterized protein
LTLEARSILDRDTKQIPFAPKAARERIAVLDIMRGIAILLIVLINFANMGNTVYEHFGYARLLGWQPIDRACWWFLRLFIDGTQRGLLQFLFGAGALILLDPTMRPDGPVGVADLYFRRNFWLVIFGLFDVFGLFWFGDILFPYGIAALLLFPLRRLNSKALLAIALVYVSVITIQAAVPYRQKAASYAAAQQASQKLASHKTLSPIEEQAIATREKQITDAQAPPLAAAAQEHAARVGPLTSYAHWLWQLWIGLVYGKMMPDYITGVFFSAVLGMALYKLGITQGNRTTGFYVCLTVFCYVPGFALRISDALVFTKFLALPNRAAIFSEFSRLLVSLGHVALINLLVRSALGKRCLAPFQAVGRTAFSGYLLQNLLGMWILFPAFGFGLYGHFGWFGLTMLAFTVIAVQIVMANLWLRWFAMGPFEWIWRSLTYKRVMPLRHRSTKADPVMA